VGATQTQKPTGATKWKRFKHKSRQDYNCTCCCRFPGAVVDVVVFASMFVMQHMF